MSTFRLFRDESPAVGDDMVGYCIGEDMGPILAFGGEDGIVTESFPPETVLSKLKLCSRRRFAGVSGTS